MLNTGNLWPPHFWPVTCSLLTFDPISPTWHSREELDCIFVSMETELSLSHWAVRNKAGWCNAVSLAITVHSHATSRSAWPTRLGLLITCNVSIHVMQRTFIYNIQIAARKHVKLIYTSENYHWPISQWLVILQSCWWLSLVWHWPKWHLNKFLKIRSYIINITL